MSVRNSLFVILLLISFRAFCQQDVDFHLNAQYFQGKTVLKVKRDFYDPYLWVLVKNNEVYRINSLTLKVDDYTPQFAAYNNLQFIDIAGRSKDTVFVATKSVNVIQLANGTSKLIDNTILGNNNTVTSVGVDYTGRTGRSDYGFGHILLIGTDKGLCRYNMDNGTSSMGPDPIYSRVFEATYRRDLYSGINLSNYPDTVTYYPVEYCNPQTVFDQWTWLNSKTFGNKLNTAFYTPYGFDNYEYVEGGNLFWGTEKGLSQNNRNQSYSTVWPGEHYLNNIPVNKITDIFGLATFGSDQFFGDPGLVKQNLLVGTDQGLYFSSSLFNNFEMVGGYNNGLRKFSLFHYDELGNIRVNDICTNLISATPSICEDGVWVACDNGLYLIKPDYATYLKSQQFHAASFNGLDATISSTKICAGSNITATINTSLYSGNAIQWYKDGAELPAESSISLVINTTGEYYAVLYDPCENIHLESNHLKVEVIEPPVYTFNYPDELRYCAGTPLTLKAGGSTDYQYRWYKDDVLTGDVTPSLSITQSGKYKVEVSSCEGSWVPSKEVQVDFMRLPVPAISADKTAYCIGDNAILSVNVSTGPDYSINWYRDNVPLPANANQASINTSIAGNYSVSVTANQANTDGTVCTQTSAPQNILFNPPPTVSIQKIVRTTLCYGQTIDLQANYNTGTVKWSTGETSDQISVSKSGNYKVTVTSPAGCSTDANVDVSFLPNPALNIPDALVCVASHKTATLTAPAALASYTWNGQPGNETFVADHPQTVTLMVTDVNNCQATQEIHVTDECPNIIIPNTFTPNGDGINDTWVIAGLEYDQSCVVRVFTRYGQQVYENKGYGSPWNGETGGKILPTGTYYYIISIKNGTQKLSGWVAIVY